MTENSAIKAKDFTELIPLQYDICKLLPISLREKI